MSCSCLPVTIFYNSSTNLDMLSKSSAVVSDTQVFTYEDMNSWANQIASVLQIKGVEY
nr:hypothetical protein P5665_17035 [Bacillus subtilis]